MDLLMLYQGRKSVRRFKETPPVPAEDINKILDAGRLHRARIILNPGASWLSGTAP
jgi:Nitroreductase family